MKKVSINLNILVIISILITLFVGARIVNKIQNNAPVNESITTTEFSERLKDEEFVSSVKNVIINEENNFIVVIMKNGEKIKVPNPRLESYKLDLLNNNIKIVDNTSKGGNVTLVTVLIVIGIIVLLGYILFTNVIKNIFSNKAKISTDSHKFKFVVPSTTFKNVAGNSEAIENLQDFIDFTKNPNKYTKVGARIPKGILLYGPSGTGKTLLAKALAGESKINFLATSGSEFVEKYVGVGASRVRDLFEIARRNSPCIIFIDEMDALCKNRDSSNNDERDSTLNQLLVEMDGVLGNEGIFLIGATNRYNMLDDAVLRPGRFDRHIEVGLPDKIERLDILKLHAKNKPLSADVDLEKIAGMTTFNSGADLENILNEASIYCAKENKSFITMEHVKKAVSKVMAGDEKKNKNTVSKELVAYHEAGHALVARLQNREVTKVTIIPTTKGAGGYTIITPLQDEIETKTHILNDVNISFGGRVAEEIKYGKDCISGGASGDLQTIKHYLEKMIKHYGLGNQLIAQEVETKELYKEMNEIADKQYNETLKLIKNNTDKLELIAKALLENETIYEEELDNIMNGIQQKDTVIFEKSNSELEESKSSVSI